MVNENVTSVAFFLFCGISLLTFAAWLLHHRDPQANYPDIWHGHQGWLGQFARYGQIHPN